MYTIAATPLNHPDLTALIAELDAYQQTLYPAESNHLIDLRSRLLGQAHQPPPDELCRLRPRR